MPKLLKRASNFSLRQLTFFAVIFGAIAGLILWRAFASTPVVATLQAERMNLPAGSSIISDTTASGGQAVKMTSSGSLTGSVTFSSQVTSLTVTAKATNQRCKGAWPSMTLSVDGSSVLPATTVSATGWTSYSASASLSAVVHNLSINYTKTSTAPRCNQALYVDVTTFYGLVTPLPQPTVALSATPTSVTAGGSSMLTWSTSNATACTASGAWSGNQPTSGSTSTGALNITSTYSLTCTGAGGSATASTTVTITAPPISAAKPVFAIYYTWWSNQHWHDRLGANYPYTQIPNPLPATLDSGGCGSVSLYSGNTLTDVSQTHGTQNFDYDVDKSGVIENDVRLAAAHGIRGFSVNWRGDGTTSQTPTSSADNRRLQAMFNAVHQVNSEGIPFKLQLDYKASDTILTTTQITNDLNYFLTTYGNDPALDHTYSPTKPEMIWSGSWKYADSVISTVSQGFRSKIYLIGDEKVATWDANAAANFDGDSYYWSSQDPYNNAASFSQLQTLANNIRSSKNPDGSNKVWLAPFTPGYNGQLLYGTTTCVPRDSGQTMHKLFDGNLQSNPDGWTFISWNEIAEGTYIVPLTRYNDFYLNTIQNIIQYNK